MLRKTNISGFVKDDESLVVTNRNLDQKQQYYSGKERILKLNSLENKVVEMQKDIEYFKKCLEEALKIKGN